MGHTFSILFDIDSFLILVQCRNYMQAKVLMQLLVSPMNASFQIFFGILH